MRKTFFICGHGDLTEEEFNKYYMPKINNALKEDSNFILGDTYGADSVVQKYLSKLAFTDYPNLYEKVLVYHIGIKPRNNFGNFNTKGGFTDEEERDSEMTKNSDEDILWIRSPQEQKKILGEKYNHYYLSRPTKNLLRRNEINYN